MSITFKTYFAIAFSSFHVIDISYKTTDNNYGMPKKTLGLIIGLALLTVVLLAVALRPLFLNPSTQPADQTAISATPTPPAYTTLMLSPNPVNVEGGSGSVEVVVDTMENSLTAAQLEISYDPKYLTNISVVPGDFFPDPLTLLNSVDTQNGRATYAMGITPAQTPVKGQGVIATVNFNIVPGATGQTQIELLPKTVVTQEGIQASVLKEATGTTVVISQSQSAPALSPSAPAQATISPAQ